MSLPVVRQLRMVPQLLCDGLFFCPAGGRAETAVLVQRLLIKSKLIDERV